MTRRILLLGAATTSLVVVVFLVPMLVLVADVVRGRSEAAATIEAQSVASLLGVVTEDAIRLSVDGLNTETNRQTTVFLPDGRQLGAPAERDAAVQRAAQAGEATTEDSAGGRAVFVPVTLGGGNRAVVRTFIPPEALAQGVRRAQQALILLGVALLGIAALVAGLLGRSLVRPLLAVARTADTLRQGNLDARATAAGPPEVRRIADALNQLADRIEELVQAERESVADISHRLRTPLTALRLDAEALPNPQDAERLLAGVDALERMVTHVISQARRPGRTGEADLAAVVRDRVDFWSVLADEQDRPVRTSLPDGPVPVRLPAETLEAAVDALLGNVFAHTAVGVGFAVEVTADPTTLVVEDAGPGIPDIELLGRGRSARTSTGLGLDIVRRTAEDAGGRLDLQDASPTGLRAVVTFPRLAHPVGAVARRTAR